MNTGMAIGGSDYGNSPQVYDTAEKMVRMPTMKDRLEMAVRHAEEKLASAKRARELFDKNPDLEELLNILQRAFYPALSEELLRLLRELPERRSAPHESLSSY